ncbi:hypothetical protein ADL02_11765 [Streptomyces sp. NRRL WC-3723]|nr:hypothetical protein ADK77_14485 [Streptomyces antibioticus]KOV92490.1 hypothetical protein ADL02_11765 [Streptomyces sp. NRRL WC-3723]
MATGPLTVARTLPGSLALPRTGPARPVTAVPRAGSLAVTLPRAGRTPVVTRPPRLVRSAFRRRRERVVVLPLATRPGTTVPRAALSGATVPRA